MLLNRDNLKLQWFWIVVFVSGTLLSVAGLYNTHDGTIRFPGGSSTIGYLIGVVAGLIIVFELLLWPRKKLLRRWRLGRVRTWMTAHIWLGLLTVPLAIVHAGIPWRGNPLEGNLASITILLLFVVVVSGIVGLILQNIIPRKMTTASPGESVYSQINVVTGQMVVEADALVSAVTGTISGDTHWSELYPRDKGGAEKGVDFIGASRSIAAIYGKAFVVEVPSQPLKNTEILGSAYQAQIRDFLKRGRNSTSLLRDPIKQVSFLDNLQSKVAPEAHFAIDQLKAWCDQRRQLDVQVSLHRWLHTWLAIHLPLSIVLLVFVVWHAVIATKYSGIFDLFIKWLN